LHLAKRKMHTNAAFGETVYAHIQWIKMKFQRIIENFWVRDIAISLLVGGLLALAGAFETHQLNMSFRLIYWVSTIFLGSLIAIGATAILDKLSWLEERQWAYHLLHLVLISSLITIMVIAINYVFLDLNFDRDAFIRFFPVVFAVAFFMSVIHFVLSQIPARSHGTPSGNETKSEIQLFARLPFKFKKAQILAINAEDHYLRVHTSVGDTMILMRLYDAIKELEGIEGSQTHRSWWVAKDAITEIVKGDGRTNFRLSNHVLAPVSRSFQNALKAQNWL